MRHRLRGLAPGHGCPSPSEAGRLVFRSGVARRKTPSSPSETDHDSTATPEPAHLLERKVRSKNAAYRGVALGFSSSMSTLSNALSRSSRACCSFKAAASNLGGASSPPRNAFRNRGSALRGRPGGEGSNYEARPWFLFKRKSARVIRGRSARLGTQADERRPRRNCSRSSSSPCCFADTCASGRVRRHLLCG
jgi:hypothetical protein